MRAATLLFLLAASACSLGEPDYESQANQLRIINDNAPQDIKTAVVRIADECRIPISSVELFHNMGPWIKQEWVIELPHAQAATPTVTRCVESEINSRGLSSTFTWGELPPPPPPRSELKEAYLLIAAERHVDDPAGVPPIPNARALLPKALNRCGIDEFREEEIAEGIFALRFTALPRDVTERISCVQREQPRGAWVQEAHF